MTTDDLPPTQYLIMEVLAARHRLGEVLWTFPSTLRPAMEQLARLQLIGWKSGVAPASIQAWLTDTGRESVLLPGYVPPILAADNCPHGWPDGKDCGPCSFDRAFEEQP